MGGDVAGGAGIRVGAPDPADRVPALEDREVLDALTAEADPHADAAEPGADHADADLAVGAVSAHVRFGHLRLSQRRAEAAADAAPEGQPGVRRRAVFTAAGARGPGGRAMDAAYARRGARE